ncbi:MAG: protein kinase [Goleter apudmare HA4340-LM2]|jgi:serine/threonine-protein kinase|nr:protein kinase [Goleter apudmare HA4340-LM2]
MNSPSTPNSWIGQSLGDRQRYRLEQPLGGGGMGVVFLAMDTRMGKQVALKLLRDTLVSSQEVRKRFEREIEISAALNNKHIVQVTDCGVTDEGYPFYVMEYLRGESLRQLLQHEQRLPVDKTVKIITETCQGLQHAHTGVTLWREGGTVSEHIQVIHRDLKPDNIFLESTDEGELVKIVDFGIAKIRSESLEQTNLTRAFLGTFRYASPEQLMGDINLDGRADIYSLGIILYEMLSATDPFGFSIKARQNSETSWIFAHTSEPPRPLRSQPGCEYLSPQLEAVVMRCLQKQPSDRFSSVEELAQALQAAANSTIYNAATYVSEETILLSQPRTTGDYDAQTTINSSVNPISFKVEEPSTQIPTVINPETQQPAELISQIPTVINPETQQPAEPITQIPTVINPETQQPAEPITQIPLDQHPPTIPQRQDTTFQNQRQLSLKEKIFPEETIVREPKKLLPSKSIIYIALISITCVGGFLIYPLITSMLTVKSIQDARAKSNYQECIAISEKVSSSSNIYQEVQGLMINCRVEYATKLASEYKCIEATQIVEKIPPKSPIFEQTRAKVDQICLVDDQNPSNSLFTSPDK